LFDPERKAEQLNLKGLNYGDSGDKKHAIEYFLLASETEGIPDTLKALYWENAAIEYVNLNKDSAIYYYEKAALLHPKNSYNNLYDKASVHLLKGETAEAGEMLLRAYDLNNKHLRANHMLGIIYMGDYDSAFYAPQKALRYNLAAYRINKTSYTELVLAKNYYYVNDPQNAAALFEDIYNKTPANVNNAADLAMIYLELGRTEEANKLLDQIRLTDPQSYNRIINLHIKLGQHSLKWRPN